MWSHVPDASVRTHLWKVWAWLAVKALWIHWRAINRYNICISDSQDVKDYYSIQMYMAKCSIITQNIRQKVHVCLDEILQYPSLILSRPQPQFQPVSVPLYLVNPPFHIGQQLSIKHPMLLIIFTDKYSKRWAAFCISNNTATRF